MSEPHAEAVPGPGRRRLVALVAAAVLVVAALWLLQNWSELYSQKESVAEKAVRLEAPGNGAAGALLYVTTSQEELPYGYEVVEALKKEMVVNGSRFLLGRVVVRNLEGSAGNFTVREGVSGRSGPGVRETTEMIQPNQSLAFEFLFEMPPADEASFYYEIRAPVKVIYHNTTRIVNGTGTSH